MTETTPRRNDPCPCGSGKKFKQCCDGKESKKAAARSKVIAAVVGSLIVLGAVSFVRSIATSNPNDRLTARPGQVWSEEHGHFH
jgi:hypothetical protein